MEVGGQMIVAVEPATAPGDLKGLDVGHRKLPRELLIPRAGKGPSRRSFVLESSRRDRG